MIVYGAPVSPYVRKVLVFAAEKGVAVENVPVSPFAPPPPEFRDASPFCKIPALKDGDVSIADSTAIVTYIEAKHPEPSLIPADPADRARAYWFDEFGDTIFTACAVKMFFNRLVAPKFLGQEGDYAAADAAERDELPKCLDYLERVIPASGFLVADRLTLADIAVATTFVNLSYVGVNPDAAAYPKTAAWAKTMLARPSFADVLAVEAQMLPRAA